MATITPTPTVGNGWVLWTWTPITESDSAAGAFVEHNPSDLIIQASGTFGSATMSVSGSLDDSTYQTNLKDMDGAAVSITAAGSSALRAGYLYIKPVFAGGTGQSATVKLLARRAGP